MEKRAEKTVLWDLKEENTESEEEGASCDKLNFKKKSSPFLC